MSTGFFLAYVAGILSALLLVWLFVTLSGKGN